MTSYDGYLWAAAASASTDAGILADRLAALIENPDLRRTMGEAGRRRARETFEWSHVFGRYQALWAELSARREAAHVGPEAAWLTSAPRVAPAWLDPFHAFGHYPTALIQADTDVALAADATQAVYRERKAHMLFGGLRLPDHVAVAMLDRLARGRASVAELAAAAGLGVDASVYIVGLLAKMELVRLDHSSLELDQAQHDEWSIPKRES
jgi:hypothetical protein